MDEAFEGLSPLSDDTMDSEHRHELAENDLARILKGVGEKYSGLGAPLAAVAIAAIAIFLGFAVVRGQASATKQEAWMQLSAASIPENYAAVAADYPDTEVSAWAKVNEGRMYLQEGIREAFTDKETSVARLDAARKAFNEALENTAAPSEVRERALAGLATYEETVSDGDTSAAVAAYQKLIDEFPEASSRKYAESRIKRLESEDAQTFYAWFSKQNPERKAPPSPLDNFGTGDVPPPPAIKDDAAEESEADTAVDGEKTTESTDGEKEGNPFAEMEKKDAGDKPATETPAAENADAEKADAEPAAEEKMTEESKPAAEPKKDAPEADAAKADEPAPADAEKAADAPAAETPAEPAADTKTE